MNAAVFPSILGQMGAWDKGRCSGMECLDEKRLSVPRCEGAEGRSGEQLIIKWVERKAKLTGSRSEHLEKRQDWNLVPGQCLEPTVSKLFSAVPMSSDSISRSSLLSVLDRQTAQATSRMPMTPMTP